MYFASVRIESKPVFHVAHVDPEKSDPRPPKTLVHDRWCCVQLFPSIALSSANLTKIRPSGGRTSSFAVYDDVAGRLVEN